MKPLLKVKVFWTSSNPSVSGARTLGALGKGAPKKNTPVGQAIFVVGDADGE